MQVLYILGSGRSGSTLLDVILGNHPSLQSVGELKQFARVRWPENALCSCGERAQHCELWSEVHRRWTQAIGTDDLASFVRQQQGFARLRNWREWSRSLDRDSPELRTFKEQTVALYRAIAEASGAGTIVDSSKAPGLALLLATTAEIDLRIVHLVRDGRGVAWSFQKKGQTAHARRRMPSRSAWQVAARWRLLNVLAERVRRRHEAAKSILVRYEDLVTRPATALEAIGRLIGEDLAPLVDRIQAGSPLEVGHLVAGNKMRKQRTVRLEGVDDAWKTGLSSLDRGALRLLAGPALRRYGYLGGESPLRLRAGRPPADGHG